MGFGLRPGSIRPLASARSDAAFRQQLKPQSARDRGCFYQTNVDDVPQPVHGTAARADQRMTRFVIVEVFGPERADRDQPVGAGIAELDEKPGAGDAGDAALKGGADPVGDYYQGGAFCGMEFDGDRGRIIDLKR